MESQSVSSALGKIYFQKSERVASRELLDSGNGGPLQACRLADEQQQENQGVVYVLGRARNRFTEILLGRSSSWFPRFVVIFGHDMFPTPSPMPSEEGYFDFFSNPCSFSVYIYF